MRGLGVWSPGERAPWPGASGDPVRTFQGQGHALLSALLLPQAQRGDLSLRYRGPQKLGEGRIQKTPFRLSLRSHPTWPCLPAMGCQGHRDKAVFTEVGSVPLLPGHGKCQGRAARSDGAEALMEAPGSYSQGSLFPSLLHWGCDNTALAVLRFPVSPPRPAPLAPQGGGGAQDTPDAESECSLLI